MAQQLQFLDELVLPLIAAPLMRLSGIELVSATCRAGVIGAFPTPNARTPEELEAWLQRLDREAEEAAGNGVPFAPYCPNLIMRSDPALMQDAVRRFVAHQTQLVITSVGSPASVIPALHDGGVLVFADVASMRHVEKAISTGVDGLVLLTAGAGGNTGWANPFAFVRAVRQVWDGPVVLGGGLSDGASLFAARALGCTLGYMGTRFVATRECLATDAYKQMVVGASLDDILLTRAFTGLLASFLRPSIVAAGLDPALLTEQLTPEQANEIFGHKGTAAPGAKRWVDLWSAGHSTSGIHDVPDVAGLVARLVREFDAAAGAAAAVSHAGARART